VTVPAPSLGVPVLFAPKAPSQKDLTNYIYYLVSSKQLKLNPCTISDALDQFVDLKNNLIKHTTASSTAGIGVDMTLAGGLKLKAFLKIWYSNFLFTERVNELGYEKAVYEYVTDRIIKTKQSPNFIPILGFDFCPIDTKFKDVPDLKLSQISGIMGTTARLAVMMTASSPTIDMGLRAFMKIDVPPYEKASVIFQVFHALYCLQRHRISHLDFHFSNILVDRLTAPICFQFKVNGRFVTTFKTNYIIKIFDYDRSVVYEDITKSFLKDLKIPAGIASKLKLETNPYYSLMSTVPDPLNFYENRDFYQAICEFLASRKYDQILELIPNKNLKYEDMVFDEKDPNLKLKLSAQTLENLKKETAVNRTVASSYYNLPIERLKIIMNPTEFDRVKTGIKKFKFLGMLYFKVSVDELSTIGGWSCQLLHAFNEEYVPVLRDFFTRPEMFELLTRNLQKTTDQPDEIFSI
jgi:hypothetical protein